MRNALGQGNKTVFPSRGFTVWVIAIAFICGALLFAPSDARAQSKPCGVGPGAPACPSAPPLRTEWRYRSSNADKFFNSLADIQQWNANVFEPNSNRCAPVFNATVPETGSGSPSYNYGILTRQDYHFDVTISGYLNGNPPCTWSYPAPIYDHVISQRDAFCPDGTLVYQAGPPVVGPYCTPPPSPLPTDPKEPKIRGNNCSSPGNGGPNFGAANAAVGSLVKSNPCDVSHGNKYQSETDYSNAATTLRFERSYNSLAAYSTNFQPRTPFSPGWSATYFQSLISVSNTDSTTTYSGVYVGRPDGRVLYFALYQGVYVPDADVADVLIGTATGYEYRTASDTIETYDTSGRLLSIAPRGHSPITLSYTGTNPFPNSATDAFGHKLTFTYTCHLSA